MGRSSKWRPVREICRKKTIGQPNFCFWSVKSGCILVASDSPQIFVENRKGSSAFSVKKYSETVLKSPKKKASPNWSLRG